MHKVPTERNRRSDSELAGVITKMARLRFPGRPVQRRGRCWVKYYQEETSLVNEQPLKTSNIERKWKLFYEIFGHSDEDEEFEGFHTHDTRMTRGITSGRRKGISIRTNILPEPPSHDSMESTKYPEDICLPDRCIGRTLDTLSKDYVLTSSMLSQEKDETLRRNKTHNLIGENTSHHFRSRGSLSKTIARLKASADMANKLVPCQRGELCTIPECEIHNISENGKNDDTSFVQISNTSISKFLNSRSKCSDMPLKKRTDFCRQQKENSSPISVSDSPIPDSSFSDSKMSLSPEIQNTQQQENFNKDENISVKCSKLNSVQNNINNMQSKSDQSDSTHKETETCGMIPPATVQKLSEELTEIKDRNNSEIVNSEEKSISKRPVQSQCLDDHLPKKKKLKGTNVSVIGSNTINNTSENLLSEKSSKNIIQTESVSSENPIPSLQPVVSLTSEVVRPNLQAPASLPPLNCATQFAANDACCSSSKVSASCSIEELIKREMVSKYADIVATKSRDRAFPENIKILSSRSDKPVFHKSRKLEKKILKIEKILKSQWEGRINTTTAFPSLLTASSHKNNLQHSNSQGRTRTILCKPRLQLNSQKLLDLHKPESVRKLNEQFQKCANSTSSMVKFPLLSIQSKSEKAPVPPPQLIPPPKPAQPKPVVKQPISVAQPTSNDPVKSLNSTVRFGHPGTITCAICGQVKYYSHVQRRFRQFSCEPCGKFFARFVRNPRSFPCLQDATCDIVSSGIESSGKKLITPSSRCKSCWLKLCWQKFVLSPHLQEQLVHYVTGVKEQSRFLGETVTPNENSVNNHLVNNEPVKRSESNQVPKLPNRRRENNYSSSHKVILPQHQQSSKMLDRRKTKRSKLEHKTENQVSKGRKPKDKSSKDNPTRMRRGPRIKHVCRRAAVVLGIPRATFSPSKRKTVNQTTTLRETNQSSLESEAEKSDLTLNEIKMSTSSKDPQDEKKLQESKAEINANNSLHHSNDVMISNPCQVSVEKSPQDNCEVHITQ